MTVRPDLTRVAGARQVAERKVAAGKAAGRATIGAVGGSRATSVTGAVAPRTAATAKRSAATPTSGAKKGRGAKRTAAPATTARRSGTGAGAGPTVATAGKGTGQRAGRAAAATGLAGARRAKKEPVTVTSDGSAATGGRALRPSLETGEGGNGQLGLVIASQVRSRRQEIGLTVGQLADRTGISKGMLSKIENAQTSPSLSTLERLAAALDIPVTSLFRGLAEERDAVFVKAGSGPEIVRRGTRAGHTYVLLGSLRGPYKRMEPLLVSLDKSTEVFPLFQHTGIEMLYMLDGVMEYSYGREQYRLERGDTLQFEGDIPHGPTQLIKTPIRFLSITTYAGDR